MPLADAAVLRQHLIDPEICIRCNTCEETCPIGAVTHDARNYVVDPAVCNACNACIPPCPTGAIDNWRNVARALAYSTAEQLGWDVLPAEGERLGVVAPASAPLLPPEAVESAGARAVFDRSPGATIPPWSASHPYVNLYTVHEPIIATVTGNHRVTHADCASDTHHIVLDFGSTPFPVLEGQSVGIIPPGLDDAGRAHWPRQYSVASPRDGERAGYNNVALTVKRVTVDREGRAMRGVCSNYLCDLAKGDRVQVTGPFGNAFLMPNHPGANLLMICTGTGSAPMRAMTERRRRRRHLREGGRLMLFFGARSEAELPYFGPLMSLPPAFMDIHLAYSRAPGAPRRYVQDAMREQADALGGLLAHPDTYVYVCGLKGMEAGVLDALAHAAAARGLEWPVLWGALKAEGRLHFETY